ncbi:hypothetical protein E4U41_007310 [Claviceps citrina]|nr:hypothetical protein E4U41_007310 [Claviceps citrina]
MAEHRRLADLYLGQPGLLTYIPSRGPDRPGILHSTRVTCHAPRFGIVGSTADLYAPSRPVFPTSASKSRDTLKVQERWLSNSHPEAFIGGAAALSDMLKDSVHCSKHSDEFHDERETLAMGEMTVMTPSGPAVTPLLAVVTGESGQKLRLAMAQRSQWRWGEHQDALLHLSVIDASQPENETVWIGNGLPIVNVKFVTTWWQTKRVRWLLVQTQTSVTLLQPEFHPIPVPDHANPRSHIFQPPSYIAPNALITLHHEETGGNDISDVCFIPASVGSLPRLGVIDQCGYWSVWTLLGTWKVGKNTLRLSLYKCGHISEGILPSLPSESKYPAQRHGMLRLGQTDGNDSPDPSNMPEKDRNTPHLSWHHVLLWNAQNIAILDLESETFLPRLDVVAQSRLAPDWIIGVERSPASGGHVFVLTARQIIWLDLSRIPGAAEPVLRPTLLVACSHVGFDNEDYRISTCQASEDDFGSTMVFLHSPKMSQLTVYWFGFAPETQLPQYHRHITSLSSEGKESAVNKAQLIKVCPAKLEAFEAPGESGPGTEYMYNDVKFYQMTILGEDLSVRYCICASSAYPGIKVTLPTFRASWSRSVERRRLKKRRKLFLKHLGDTFVIPDGMTDENLDTLLRLKGRKTETEEMLDQDGVEHKPRPKLLNLDRICQEIASQLLSTIDQGPCGLPTEMTALEPIPYGAPSDGMESDIHDLIMSSTEKNKVVVTQLRRRGADEPPGSLLEYSSLLKQFSDFWLNSAATSSFTQEMHDIRYIWVCEVARDFLLSSYGFTLQDVPLLQPDSSNAAEGCHADDVSPQQSDAGDAVFQRLRLVAPTLEPGTLGSLKAARILSYWPTGRGVEVGDYVSSVAVAEEAKFAHIKERRRRVESRMRAQSEKYKIPPFRRQGFPPAGNGMRRDQDDAVTDTQQRQRRPPPMQIMSSQQAVPDSSQSIGGGAGPSVSMTQPVSGVFGTRRMVKKGKKKSGFR